jgi:hypothetical protein
MQGLYHQILPTREEVFPAALAFAKELAATTSQVSVAVTKGLLQNPGDTIEENHLHDSRGIRELAVTDGEEGIRSFREKRAPKFTGTLSKDLGSWFPWVSPCAALRISYSFIGPVEASRYEASQVQIVRHESCMNSILFGSVSSVHRL